MSASKYENMVKAEIPQAEIYFKKGFGYRIVRGTRVKGGFLCEFKPSLQLAWQSVAERISALETSKNE